MRIHRGIEHLLLAVAGLTLATQAPAAAPAPAGAYRDECGSCHVAYSPQLLPRPEWARVLGDLEHHYGVDATLDPATLQSIERELGVARTATPAAGQPLPRITTQPWFRHEHDEVGAATFRSPAVRSAANCGACHVDAGRGDFDEDHIRIPR